MFGVSWRLTWHCRLSGLLLLGAYALVILRGQIIRHPPIVPRVGGHRPLRLSACLDRLLDDINALFPGNGPGKPPAGLDQLTEHALPGGRGLLCGAGSGRGVRAAGAGRPEVPARPGPASCPRAGRAAPGRDYSVAFWDNRRRRPSRHQQLSRGPLTRAPACLLPGSGVLQPDPYCASSSAFSGVNPAGRVIGWLRSQESCWEPAPENACSLRIERETARPLRLSTWRGSLRSLCASAGICSWLVEDLIVDPVGVAHPAEVEEVALGSLAHGH